MSEIDLFSDMMDEDHAGFGALKAIMNPSKAVHKVREGLMPEGMVISYNCPDCAKEAHLLYSWAEIYIIANGIMPQRAVGITDVWQADAQYPTAFGYATQCRACRREQAPIMYSIREAQADLGNHPFYKQNKDVQSVAPLVRAFLAQHQQQR